MDSELMDLANHQDVIVFISIMIQVVYQVIFDRLGDIQTITDLEVDGIVLQNLQLQSKLHSTKKRYSVDSENHSFKEEWAEKCVFILPEESTKPMCLICNETMDIVKSVNVRHHYETNHTHCEQNYLQNTEVITKIHKLKSSYQTRRIQ